jgi:hypothetical protein
MMQPRAPHPVGGAAGDAGLCYTVVDRNQESCCTGAGVPRPGRICRAAVEVPSPVPVLKKSRTLRTHKASMYVFRSGAPLLN